MRQNSLSRAGLLLLGIALTGISSAIGCAANSALSPAPPSITTSSPPAVTALKSSPISSTPSISALPDQTPSSTPKPASSPAPSPAAYTVNVSSSTLIGDYLVDGRGITLYYTTSDKPGYSNLPDETLSTWPVFYVSGIVVPPSLKASDFGTYNRDSKVKQTTYKGYPLYYFFQDKATGTTLGNRLGDVWFVVNP
jgi:predicted lipoprotein with Yx(FWY)xxD motif